jgi:hypothetical protein
MSNFEPIIIELRDSQTHGNETIEKLVFGREMCGGDLRGGIKVDNPSYDDIATVASRITGYPEPVFRKMPWHDFSKVVKVVMDFFNDSPLTGGKE